MFYRIDFTYRQYSRRRVFKSAMVGLFLILLLIGAVMGLRLNEIVRQPTLYEHLSSSNEYSARIQLATCDWQQSQRKFDEFKPFWLLDTAQTPSSDVLSLVLTNQATWSRWLSPKSISMRANGDAIMEFRLWFQDVSDKRVAVVEATNQLQRSLAEWKWPSDIIVEAVTIADRESIDVKVVSRPPRHQWTAGMPAIPKRLLDQATAFTNQHNIVWSYKLIEWEPKGATLKSAMAQAQLDVAPYLPTDKRREIQSSWDALTSESLSPDAVLNQIDKDLDFMGVTRGRDKLVMLRKTWYDISRRRLLRVRELDNSELSAFVSKCKAFYEIKHPPPPHSTFEGFNKWAATYRPSFTNCFTRGDIFDNGRERILLRQMAEGSIAEIEPVITCKNRNPSQGSAIGYSDWEIIYRGSDKDGGATLAQLERMASYFTRPKERGVRLDNLEVRFNDQLRPRVAWSSPPISATYKGILPWQAKTIEGGQP